METQKKLLIKGGKKELFFGRLIAFIVKIFAITIRCRIHDPHNICAKPNQIIFAFWHGSLLANTIAWVKTNKRSSPLTCLTSSSRDGSIIAAFMKCFAIHSIRGSSSRRGLTALMEMKKAIESGSDIAITPDGPKGPAEICQGGVIKLSQLTSTPICPLTVTCSRTFKLSTWDRFFIPLPFSSIDLHLHPLIQVSRRADESTLEARRQELEIALSKSANTL